MQFLKIKDNMSLSELTDAVGSRNVDSVLNLNSLTRTPNIGKQFRNLVNDKINAVNTVPYQKKSTILNNLTADADVFETAALQSEGGWKVLDSLGTMPGMLKIPETITLPDSVSLLGGSGTPISKNVYEKAMKFLADEKDIDPVIFNEYSSRRSSQIMDITTVSNPIQWFKLPWGEISLFSSLSGKSIDFPVYPKGFDDSVHATYVGP